MRRPRAALGIALLTVAPLGAACATAKGGTVDQLASCPVPESAPAFDSTRIEQLEGTFRLTVVSDSHPSPGARTSGRLLLREQPSEAKRERTLGAQYVGDVPLIGSTDVDLSVLGVATTGDPTSTDPDRPGVYLSVAGSVFQLRVGSQPGYLDGYLMILDLLRVSERGFRGTWEPSYGFQVLVDTITGELIHVGGEFCAERTAGSA